MKEERKETKDIRENERYCIFEKRLCKYANKNGNCFKCEAPTDDAMTCRR